MRLLMRHASRTGRSIVLVTRRQGLRQVAHSEGQRCAGSLRRVRFGGPAGLASVILGVDLPIPGVSSIVWLMSLSLILVAAVVAAFWYLPSAAVTLYPASAPVAAEADSTPRSDSESSRPGQQRCARGSSEGLSFADALAACNGFRDR